MAFGVEKSVGKAAAEENLVGFFEEVFDDADFGVNFGAAKDHREGLFDFSFEKRF